MRQPVPVCEAGEEKEGASTMSEKKGKQKIPYLLDKEDREDLILFNEEDETLPKGKQWRCMNCGHSKSQHKILPDGDTSCMICSCPCYYGRTKGRWK